MFIDPVDLEVVREYCFAVPYPISLSIITERLKNRFYRCACMHGYVRLLMWTSKLDFLAIVVFFLLLSSFSFPFRRKLALAWDVILLTSNALAYNEGDSLIVKHSRIVANTVLKFIRYHSHKLRVRLSNEILSRFKWFYLIWKML